jgi:peroxiredoxin
MKRKFRVVLKVSLVISITLAAYFLGSEVGDILKQRNRDKSRSELSQSVISQMQEIKLGDTIANHLFEQLGDDSVWLFDLLSEKSVIIIVSPECPSCKDEIQELKFALRKDISNANYFIFASSGNPRMLEDIKNEFELKSPILYDHRNTYFSRYDIFTFPFNITVNKQGVILEMLTGTLLKEDFEEIIEYNKKSEQKLN